MTSPTERHYLGDDSLIRQSGQRTTALGFIAGKSTRRPCQAMQKFAWNDCTYRSKKFASIVMMVWSCVVFGGKLSHLQLLLVELFSCSPCRCSDVLHSQCNQKRSTCKRKTAPQSNRKQKSSTTSRKFPIVGKKGGDRVASFI